MCLNDSPASSVPETSSTAPPASRIASSLDRPGPCTHTLPQLARFERRSVVKDPSIARSAPSDDENDCGDRGVPLLES